GYVAHACEVTRTKHNKRVFRHSRQLNFTESTCFILSESGISFARNLCTYNFARSILAATCAHLDQTSYGPEPPPTKPKWDPHRHGLTLGGKLIKRVRLPAFNQKAILAAFEEEGWPFRIDDPLPPRCGVHAKERLHQAIKNLNKNQKHRLIRFNGDGSGQGI